MFVMSADPKLVQWQGTLGEPAGADGVHEPQVGSDERLLQRIREGLWRRQFSRSLLAAAHLAHGVAQRGCADRLGSRMTEMGVHGPDS
jgi:hypothetical protein